MSRRRIHEDLADGGFSCSWMRADTQEPLRDGMIDAPVNEGRWEVQTDGGGSTVTYHLKSGGWVQSSAFAGPSCRGSAAPSTFSERGWGS